MHKGSGLCYSKETGKREGGWEARLLLQIQFSNGFGQFDKSF